MRSPIHAFSRALRRTFARTLSRDWRLAALAPLSLLGSLSLAAQLAPAPAPVPATPAQAATASGIGPAKAAVGSGANASTPWSALQPPPTTPRRPVSDSFHGQAVSEDYRWLENTGSSEVKAWVQAQNQRSRQALDALPQRAGLAQELSAMTGGERAVRYGFELVAGQLFALKHQPPRNQDLLVVLNGQAELSSERVLLDPNTLDASGKTSIDWFKPSPDGKLVAVSLSKNGSEDGTLFLYRTDNSQALPDVVPRVQFATGGGSVAWAADGKGLYYTRYPQGRERVAADLNFYQQVYFHRLGTSASQDRYVIGKEFPRIAETVLVSSDDGRQLLADVANGDGGEHGFWLRSETGPAAGRWRQIAGFTDGLRHAQFGRDGLLYAISTQGSPRGRVVVMDPNEPQATLRQAKTLVPQGDAVIEAMAVTADRLTVQVLRGGPSELRRYRLSGAPLGAVAAPPLAANVLGARLDGDELLVGSQSHTQAFTWYRLDVGAAETQLKPTLLAEAPIFATAWGLPDVEALRVMAVSKDGVPVPMTIIRRVGTPLDGQQPVLLTGYGGFGISLRPQFSRDVALWLRHGGVWVQANLRGGGEFGESWHADGQLTRKQNVFDDFIACAETLVQMKLTNPQRLAILGGSNGGLLMGAALTQRPALFRAVVAQVGIYDMLRVEKTSNGAFNVTEYGSVQHPEQFRSLLAYSPLHQVKDGSTYPAVLFTTGEHDGRVEPWMSYKMTARLQAAQTGADAAGRPVLLRVDADAGHGIGTSLSAEVAEQADIFAFLFAQLGMR